MRIEPARDRITPIAHVAGLTALREMDRSGKRWLAVSAVGVHFSAVVTRASKFLGQSPPPECLTGIKDILRW